MCVKQHENSERLEQLLHMAIPKKMSNADAVCLDPFDATLKLNCGGNKELRYYYNITAQQCISFVYDLNVVYHRQQHNHYNRLHSAQALSQPSAVIQDKERCLKPFDETYQHDCWGSNTWEKRYYYDRSSNECIMFWYGGCSSINSQNIFDTTKSCENACTKMSEDEPYRKHQLKFNKHMNTKIDDRCLDSFDVSLKRNCNGFKDVRSYYNLTSQQCEFFSLDLNCKHTTATRNLFNFYECEKLCNPTIQMQSSTTAAKLEKLPKITSLHMISSPNENGNISYAQDLLAVAEMCGDGDWKPRYYYDRTEGTCRIFWWDQCKSSSRNYFEELVTCQRKCEGMIAIGQYSKKKPHYTVQILPKKLNASQRVTCDKRKIRGTETVQSLKHFKYVGKNRTFVVAEACLEPFEEWLLCSCRQGKWVRRYYYSNSERKCRMYWYDGCEGSTKNDFDDLSTCLAKCEGILPSNKLESHSEVILNVLVINLKKL
ncbi:unnamed protein product [Enterobius vermicularis]|uniref:BPTI/Kunitz inhibitor domain-containing protein n=1 Tax=Enterobius vermicularis TaxID=51028 RepID=A0A0N4UT66_ENTVE|nr:unnamed protein product [Enterobius vermicularis]